MAETKFRIVLTSCQGKGRASGEYMRDLLLYLQNLKSERGIIKMLSLTIKLGTQIHGCF